MSQLGNLDPDTSDDILYLLSRLTREFGTSTIVATHDYRLLDKFPAGCTSVLMEN